MLGIRCEVIYTGWVSRYTTNLLHQQGDRRAELGGAEVKAGKKRLYPIGLGNALRGEIETGNQFVGQTLDTADRIESRRDRTGLYTSSQLGISLDPPRFRQEIHTAAFY